MKFLSSVGMVVVLGVLPLHSNAGSLEGFVCKSALPEAGEEGTKPDATQTLGFELDISFGAGPRGTDLTLIRYAGGEIQIRGGYSTKISPHYRWGYKETYSTELSAQGFGLRFGGLDVSVELRGPGYGPNDEATYKVRSIYGVLTLVDDPDEHSQSSALVKVPKRVYLKCAEKINPSGSALSEF